VHRVPRGFSLLEVVVATSILVVGVAGVAPLLVLASRANQSARNTTQASLLAQQKMEQLRALEWARDPSGGLLSDVDTDLTVAFAVGSGGSGLRPSPAGSLDRNVDGFCDFIAADGRVVGGGSVPPAGAAYVRRWSIEPLPPDADEALVLQVLVRRDGSLPMSPEDVRLTSIRVRGGL
jgi:prepilin-type N-terminal cleavage/methylation domain-containing protein